MSKSHCDDCRHTKYLEFSIMVCGNMEVEAPRASFIDNLYDNREDTVNINSKDDKIDVNLVLG